MRYLKHASTDEVRHIPHDDDASFRELLAERDEDTGRQVWHQTGEQDPDVAATITAEIEGFTAEIPAAAANATTTTVVVEVPKDGKVTKVVYVPKAGITGANTDSRTLALVNKGDDGAGSTSVASLALTSGVNATAFDAKEITLSGTAANKAVDAGDVLVLTSTHVGTGIADPGGRVIVSIDAD